MNENKVLEMLAWPLEDRRAVVAALIRAMQAVGESESPDRSQDLHFLAMLALSFGEVVGSKDPL